MDKKTKKYLLMFLALVLAIALALFAVKVYAAPFLVCDCQDNVEWYVITIDSGTPIQSTAVATDCTGSQKRLSLDMAPLSLADGQHSLTGYAANVWGQSTSVPFDFSKVVPGTQHGTGLSQTP